MSENNSDNKIQDNKVNNDTLDSIKNIAKDAKSKNDKSKAKETDAHDDKDIENSYHSFIVTDDDIAEAKSKGKTSEFGDLTYSNKSAERENKKLDKMAAKRELDKQRQAERDAITPDQRKKKRRKVIIIVLIFIFLAIAGGVGYYLYNLNKAITTLKLNNVSATLEVECVIFDKLDNSRTPVKVNGAESAKLVFNHTDTDENNILERNLVFDNISNMSGTSTIVFFYKITNTSNIGSMFVDLAKLQADDHNFNFGGYYRTSKGETLNELHESRCYTKNGKLYETLRECNDEVNPVEQVYLINKFEVKPGETLAIRLEAKVTEPLFDARCNCSFRFDLFNNNYMAGEITEP